MRFALLLLLLYGATSFAGPLAVDYLAVETSTFQGNRDPYTPSTAANEYKNRAALTWNVSLFGAAYWNNWCHTETTNGGVKTVGWQWEGGLHILPWLDMYRAHHSRHIVEESSEVSWPGSAGRFPVEDSIGLRFVVVPHSTIRSLFP